MTDKCEKVAIIIPVLNCEKYIGKCIDSIVNQTYRNLEIMLILGNSEDKTDMLAEEWAKKDSRIKVIRQTGGRLGTARNEAVSAVGSDIIAFVDADDWIDKTFVEKMYTQMINCENDLVICDRDNVIYGTDGLVSAIRPVYMAAMDDDAVSVDENAELIRSIEVSVNGKLYRKKIFEDNGIIQPDIFGEDRAVMHFIISRCHRIGRVKETLYHYRKDHGSNSVSSVKTYFTAAECMEYIRDYFEAAGIYDKYEGQLASAFQTIASLGYSNLRKASYTESKDAESAQKKIAKFIDTNGVDKIGKRYIWGSYSLRRMTLHAFPQSGEKREHYCYSGIMSAMAKEPLEAYLPGIRCSGNHERWLYADINKSFRRNFNPGSNDILLIDFLEERFPIVSCFDSKYTFSTLIQEWPDLYKYLGEKGINGVMDGNSDDWKDACADFIRFISGRIDNKRIILVENYLSSQYGSISKRKAFDDTGVINSINSKLNSYYKFFAENIPGIGILKTVESDAHYFYTAADFDFGCHPWHYNNNYYMRQGSACRKLLRSRADGLFG